MMTRHRMTNWIGMICAAVVLFGFTQNAVAAGTMAGTTISNQATVSYYVNSIEQAPIPSSPNGNSNPYPDAGLNLNTEFVVDNKVNLTVAWKQVTYTEVTPKQTAAVLTFTVTNNGNSVQDYALSAILNGTDLLGEGINNFEATDIAWFVENIDESTNLADGYDVADTATYIDELTPDSSKTVYVVANIPDTPKNGDWSAIALTATTHDGGTSGTPGDLTANQSTAAYDATVAQVVWADGEGATDSANDGTHSAIGAYKVKAAALTVTKTAQVFSDPFSSGKAIPGAIILYTIEVKNAVGAETASSITISDTMTEGMAGVTFVDYDDTQAGYGIAFTAPDSVVTLLTNAADTDQGSWDSSTNTVTVTGISLEAGKSATVEFKVKINEE